MLQLLTQPNGRPTTAMGFGSASWLRIPDTEQRQRLLDIAVDGGILLLEPNPDDWIDPVLELTLHEFQQHGWIGAHGISGDWPDRECLIAARPSLAGGLVQWEDDLLDPVTARESFPTEPLRLLVRFGRNRRSLVKIQQAFAAVPQLQHQWSERLNLDLADADALGATLLGGHWPLTQANCCFTPAPMPIALAAPWPGSTMFPGRQPMLSPSRPSGGPTPAPPHCREPHRST